MHNIDMLHGCDIESIMWRRLCCRVTPSTACCGRPFGQWRPLCRLSSMLPCYGKRQHYKLTKKIVTVFCHIVATGLLAGTWEDSWIRHADTTIFLDGKRWEEEATLSIVVSCFVHVPVFTLYACLVLQALECSLADVEPLENGQWSKEVSVNYCLSESLPRLTKCAVVWWMSTQELSGKWVSSIRFWNHFYSLKQVSCQSFSCVRKFCSA